MKHLRLTRRDQRGAALLEAALVMPLLILLAFATIDVGRAIYTQIQLNDVAQEGTIYGAYFPDQTTAIVDRVTDSADNLSIAVSDVTIDCPTTPDAIKVSVSTELAAITPIFFGHTFTLRAAQEGDLLTDDLACATWPSDDD